MFREEDYVNCEEPYAGLEVPEAGCTWAGCLYQRTNGGFDLFYDHANSEFKPLDLGKITHLRQMSQEENGVVFITHLDNEKSQKKLFERARQSLLEWVSSTIGN
jgi:hypothetical protein